MKMSFGFSNYISELKIAEKSLKTQVFVLCTLDNKIIILNKISEGVSI